MHLGKKQEFDWPFAMIVSDLCALLATLLIEGVFEKAHFGSSLHYGISLDLRKSLLFAALTLYTLHFCGLYKWRALTRRNGSPGRIAIVMILAGVSFVGIHEAFLGSLSVIERKSLEWVIFYGFGLIWLFRLGMRPLVGNILHLIPEERIIFIGWSSRIARLLQAFQSDMGQFQKVIGFIRIEDDLAKEPAQEKGFQCLGPISKTEKILLCEEATIVLVDETNLDATQINQISEICSRCLVNFKIIPTAFELLAGTLGLRIVAGVPLLGIYGLRYDQYHNRLLKRSVDILGAIVGLILSAPIIGLCMILIKRESPGPAFFRQRRIGWHGKPFDILKLRSMKLNSETAETGAQWTVENDPRRLKIGAFLRKWNLDETPQFWNVLKGDMSLVGPRPEALDFVETFRMTLRHYNLRHSCRPGMTGWAAINGLRGNTSLTERLEYDLFYIENWSLLLDFQIMAMTFFPPKNAY